MAVGTERPLSLKGHGSWKRRARTRERKCHSCLPEQEGGWGMEGWNYRPWEGDGPTTPENHFQSNRDKKLTVNSQHEFTKGSFANP